MRLIKPLSHYLDASVTPVELWRGVHPIFDVGLLHVFEDVHMLVVLLAVGPDRIALAGIPKHVEQDGHLAMIPVIRGRHILNAQVRAMIDALQI